MQARLLTGRKAFVSIISEAVRSHRAAVDGAAPARLPLAVRRRKGTLFSV